jgi:periplasmic divalent cation tolerance protein
MAETPTTARIVLTTVASAGEASRIGRILVTERLVACATVIPSVESIYEWEGKTELATETLMLLKTDAERIPALEARLITLHSYETPEFLVLPVEAGSTGYLNWMQSVLSGRVAE